MKFEKHGSSGVAKGALATAIPAATLSGLNFLSNLTGASCRGNDCYVCSEDHPVDRYTLDMYSRNSKLQSENDMLRAERDTDKKILDLYQFTDRQLRQVRDELCDQKVVNQKTADSFQLLSERMDSQIRETRNLVEQECKARNCADHSLLTYLNATFVPITVAQCEVGGETYMQKVYDPLPACNC